MKKITMHKRRQLLHGLCGIAALPILSSCGTIIYPDRVNQSGRKDLDPIVIILDGVGLFFFLVPGIVAFAVDFATGAIYLPEDRDKKERTIFDDISSNKRPKKRLQHEDIERIVGEHVGQKIDLARPDVRAMHLEHLDQFQMAQAQCSGNILIASR
jgi:hypothetical protein